MPWHLLLVLACIASQLGDREKFEQFERKEPRRAQQLKAAARRERKAARNAGGDDDFSVLTLVFVCVSFGLFTLAAGYLVLKNLLPSRPQ